MTCETLQEDVSSPITDFHEILLTFLPYYVTLITLNRAILVRRIEKAIRKTQPFSLPFFTPSAVLKILSDMKSLSRLMRSARLLCPLCMKRHPSSTAVCPEKNARIPAVYVEDVKRGVPVVVMLAIGIFQF